MNNDKKRNGDFERIENETWQESVMTTLSVTKTSHGKMRNRDFERIETDR